MKKFLILVVFLFSLSVNSQNSNNGIVVLWDASLSMKDRDLEKDLSFLEKHLKLKKTKVKLIVFNNQVTENISFNSDNFTALKQKLKSITYDGSTDYSLLPRYVDNQNEVLFFTDGVNTTNDNLKIFNSNCYIINSNKELNDNVLKMFVDVNQATLIDFSNKSNDDVVSKITSTNKIKYSGTVYNINSPVDNAKLSIDGVDKIFYTDKTGMFSLEAKKGSVLNVKYGEFSKKYVLGDRTTLLVNFLDDGDVLDEVKVRGVATHKQIGISNKKLTAYGYRNVDRIGYGVQSISSEQINPNSINISSSLKGKFNGLYYKDNQDISQARVRGGNHSFKLNKNVLVVVDGAPITRTISNLLTPLSFVEPDNISNVTVLKGLAATNRYGSEGANGVVLITTKLGALNVNNSRDKKLTLLNNNIYEDKNLKKYENVKMPYIVELGRLKKIKEAYDYYMNDRIKYLDKPEYFINVYHFFKQTDDEIANRILSNILELFSEDINVMRTLAFVYEAGGNYRDALTIYERVLRMNKKSSQSHLDLLNANALNSNKEVVKEQLIKIVNSKVNNVNFSGLNKVLTNDVRNILRNNDLGIKGEIIDSKYFHNTTYDTRIVLRWNNPSAEFDVQFVNPLKRFVNWEHTINSSRGRIIEEKEQGYYAEEFHINAEIKELKGEWIMNIRDYSSGNLPNYFLIIMYRNFGKPNQKKEIKLYNTIEKGENQNVLKFII